MESKEDFSSLLSEYDLEQLVTAGTLLTPYLMQLENVTFVLKTPVSYTHLDVYKRQGYRG